MIDPRPLIHLMDGEQDASEVGVRLDRMIQAGLDPNWVDPEQDRSILEIALANARWEAALRLIQAGARVRDTERVSYLYRHLDAGSIVSGAGGRTVLDGHRMDAVRSALTLTRPQRRHLRKTILPIRRQHPHRRF